MGLKTPTGLVYFNHLFTGLKHYAEQLTFFNQELIASSRYPSTQRYPIELLT